MPPLHSHLYDFHQTFVRVPDDLITRLRVARDVNVDRLAEGLELLGAPRFRRHLGQGGHAMHTLTQRPDGNQDLDVALIFDARDLPDDPLAARTHVHHAAMTVAPRGFRQPPERRTNAITVWYADGYHIDFAVYRQIRGRIEHAGPQWALADPAGTPRWFTRQASRSPVWQPGALVQDGQLRRVVRFFKWLRHLSGAEQPGGFIVTALVCQCYQPRPDGDDASIFTTGREMLRYLQAGRALREPVVGLQKLAHRRVDAQRLANFGQVLADFFDAFIPWAQGRSDPLSCWEAAIGTTLR